KRIVYLLPADGRVATDHTSATCRDLAERVAVLLGRDFGGAFGPGDRPVPGAYWVPVETLPAAGAAELGIASEDDLLGGVVPYRFQATKAISHATIGPDARVPAGWSPALGPALGDAVLPGYSAFCVEDARIAGRRLLPRGAVRVKLASGVGGSDQRTVQDAAGLDAAIEAFDPAAVQRHGIVVELALDGATAYSIG